MGGSWYYYCRYIQLCILLKFFSLEHSIRQKECSDAIVICKRNDYSDKPMFSRWINFSSVSKMCMTKRWVAMIYSLLCFDSWKLWNAGKQAFFTFFNCVNVLMKKKMVHDRGFEPTTFWSKLEVTLTNTAFIILERRHIYSTFLHYLLWDDMQVRYLRLWHKRRNYSVEYQEKIKNYKKLVD